MSEEKLNRAVVLWEPRWQLCLRWACLHLSCIIFFPWTSSMCCSDTAVSATTGWTRSRSLLGAIRGEKENAGGFSSWIVFHTCSKLCVLCQNQVYWNTLQIRAVGQEGCLTSCQASDTLSDHHWKAIRNTFRDHQL